MGNACYYKMLKKFFFNFSLLFPFLYTVTNDKFVAWESFIPHGSLRLGSVVFVCIFLWHSVVRLSMYTFLLKLFLVSGYLHSNRCSHTFCYGYILHYFCLFRKRCFNFVLGWDPYNHVMGVPVTMAWCVLDVCMEDMASRFGG
jgi:hypothetical protein